jgi:hypothetical protein
VSVKSFTALVEHGDLASKLGLDDLSEYSPEDYSYDLNLQGHAEVLDALGVAYNVKTLGDSPYLLVAYNGENYIIEEDGTVETTSEWIYRLRDAEVYSIIEPFLKETSFWDDVSHNSICYHATEPENIESIQRDGLRMENKSRGIENRSTGSAVFATMEFDEMGSYGSAAFEIHLGRMKDDGYMPEVTQEGPIEEAKHLEILAHLVGLEDFDPYSSLGSGGIHEATIVIFGGIPPKYLSLMED